MGDRVADCHPRSVFNWCPWSCPCKQLPSGDTSCLRVCTDDFEGRGAWLGKPSIISGGTRYRGRDYWGKGVSDIRGKKATAYWKSVDHVGICRRFEMVECRG